MKYAIPSTILTLLLLTTGCTNSMDIPSPSGHSSDTQRHTPLPMNDGSNQKVQTSDEKLKSYQTTMRTVASGIKADPNYERIVLDSPEKKEWFQDITYKLWDKQISDSEFIEQGLAKYPTHRYEFKFIANGFNIHR